MNLESCSVDIVKVSDFALIAPGKMPQFGPFMTAKLLKAFLEEADISPMRPWACPCRLGSMFGHSGGELKFHLPYLRLSW